ncbi:hypothetical protein [Mycobacteroides franklinii]|uniref:HicB family toxin-antitoxin system n=1 Tax=Mycobacteroides franklinii TaxID=948102 RepID=A0A4R5PG41_9MYCO|nr:hypothetical protein [Mycobacteroides franklinii]ORA57247.1 hypothetical protein BST24_23870 [Mycobacteroides franklinii]TDH25346.1 HicB family toxin-antitoxin system [Mycobacteroides franklinii]
MATYDVKVTRDGKWWMIHVPALRGFKDASGAENLSDVTQARRLSDVPTQARDFICTVTDVAPSEVELSISISVDELDVSARAEKVRTDRELGERYAAASRDEAQALARDLAARGVAVRDVGDVLGLSFQRAQQLIST